MNSTYSTQDCTIERIREAMAAIWAIPKPEFDCVVMVDSAYQKIKEHLEAITPQVIPLQSITKFYGLQIFACDDEIDARIEQVRLAEQGRRPMLVLEDTQ
jgi:hypothetical protein